MTVLLVLATFALLMAVDYLRTARKQEIPLAARPAATKAERAHALPEIVAGFRVAPKFSYHPGHTWAMKESSDVVRIGIDDFAGKLAGPLDAINLPQVGRWVTQGQKACTLQHQGAKVDMVAPIDGTVLEINEAVLRDPELARRDPYGDGWLMLVNAPDTKIKFRNLLNGPLARLWTEEAATRLMRQLPHQPAMADGGLALDNLSAEVPLADWSALTRSFFLT